MPDRSTFHPLFRLFFTKEPAIIRQKTRSNTWRVHARDDTPRSRRKQNEDPRFYANPCRTEFNYALNASSLTPFFTPVCFVLSLFSWLAGLKPPYTEAAAPVELHKRHRYSTFNDCPRIHCTRFQRI